MLQCLQLHWLHNHWKGSTWNQLLVKEIKHSGHQTKEFNHTDCTLSENTVKYWAFDTGHWTMAFTCGFTTNKSENILLASGFHIHLSLTYFISALWRKHFFRWCLTLYWMSWRISVTAFRPTCSFPIWNTTAKMNFSVLLYLKLWNTEVNQNTEFCTRFYLSYPTLY